MPRVAFHTFAVLRGDWDDPLVSGFVERVPLAYASAECSVGFVDRARRMASIGDPSTSWGQMAYPRFVEERSQKRVAATCSLWQDLESVYAFAYSGAHGESMKHRKEWFEDTGWPTYVAWWVDDGVTPEFSEGAARLEHLHDHGPTPHAFGFRNAFTADGREATVDLDVVKRHIAANAASVATVGEVTERDTLAR